MRYHIIHRISETATIQRSIHGASKYIGSIEADNEANAIEQALIDYYSDDLFFNEDNTVGTNGAGRVIWEKHDNSIEECDYQVVAVTDTELVNDYPQYEDKVN